MYIRQVRLCASPAHIRGRSVEKPPDDIFATNFILKTIQLHVNN